MTEKRYIVIVKISAWYALIVTAAFSTPWTFALLYDTLQSAHAALLLPGEIPDLRVTEVMFANFFGTVAVIWALVRLKRPSVLLGRFDVFERFFFAVWEIYAVAAGASSILLGFATVEILFAVLQALPVRRT